MSRPGRTGNNCGMKKAWLCAAFYLGVAFLPALLSAGVEAAAPKQVLLIHSFGRDFAPYTPTGTALRAELPA